MGVLNKLMVPVRWLLTKEKKVVKMSEPVKDAPVVAADIPKEKQLSNGDEISRFATNLKRILIASGYDVDIIFDDAVSIAKKI